MFSFGILYITLALFTQRCHIIATVAVRQFSAVVCSHRVQHLHLKEELLCNSHRKKRGVAVHGHDNVVCVF